ncbi:MAG: queuosine precursor transporter [Chlamydiota bacterium]
MEVSNIDRSEKVFIVLTALFCVNLVLTNVIAAKLFVIPFMPKIALSVGDLTYPVTFLVTDIISEIWGKQRARFVVLLGLAMNIFMLLVVQTAVHVPPHQYWFVPDNAFGYQNTEQYQAAYTSVFGASFFMVLGSMMAYLTSQLLDVKIFHYLKKATSGRHLWLRNNGSTMTSQLVDSFIFWTVFLYIGMGHPFSVTLIVMLSSYVCKLILAAFDTPFCYLGVAFIRKVMNPRFSKLKATN